MSKQIGITTVLAQINTLVNGTSPQTFQIGWIRKSGERRGTMKRVKLARKRISRVNKPKETSKGGFRLKENKTILLEDVVTNDPFYVGIETIIEFNGEKVRH